jgi:amidase
MMAHNYKDISSIARQRRDAALISFYDLPSIDQTNLPNDLTAFTLQSGIYGADEVEILQSEAEDILQKVRDRIWTSLEVTEAFMKAAAVAQKMVSLTARQEIG